MLTMFLGLVSSAFSFAKSILFELLPIERLFRTLFAPYQYAYDNLSAGLQTAINYFSPIPTAQSGAEYKWNSVVCQESGFKYPKDDSMDTVSGDDRQEIISKLQYALRHAGGIYPPWYLSYHRMLPDLMAIFKSTKELVADRFGLDASDKWLIYPKNKDSLIHQRWTFLNKLPGMASRGNNDLFKPVFYFMQDEKKGCYVLTIRGSISMNDWITDFIESTSATPEFYIGGVGGQVHDGMLKSAQYIYDEVIDDIRQIYANQKEHKQLIVTGHSLGAGVASLIGLLVLRESSKNKDILPYFHVYSFATPSVVSKKIAEMKVAQKHITSIILNTDIVSRGSSAAAREYKKRIKFIEQSPEKSVTELGLHFAKRPLLRQVANVDDILSPVGTVYWFIPKNLENKGKFGLLEVLKSLLLADNTHFAAKDWKLKRASKNREIFGELLFDGFESVFAHLPNRYAWAIGLSASLQIESSNAC